MKRNIMKLLNEGDFDSYVNMGNMGTEQEMNTNEDEQFTDSPYKEIGALSAMVAHGILGWSQGERGLQAVMDSDVLSDNTKESIKKMVEDLSGNSTQNVSNEIGDVQVGDQNELMESAKEKLKKEFKRLIRG